MAALLSSLTVGLCLVGAQTNIFFSLICVASGWMGAHLETVLHNRVYPLGPKRWRYPSVLLVDPHVED